MIKILKGTLCCRIGEEEEEQPLVAFTPHPNMQFTSHYSNNQQQLPPEGRALTNLYSLVQNSSLYSTTTDDESDSLRKDTVQEHSARQ